MTVAEPELMWTMVADQAIAASRCKSDGECRVHTTFHPAGWGVVSHISARPHACITCLPRATPEHLISAYTLLHTERRALVATVAAWLDHLHELSSAPDLSPAA